MNRFLPKQAQSFPLALLAMLVAVLACGGSPPQPAATGSDFNFAVIVMDQNKNSHVGQAKVVLSVGNETLAQEITDDNGQANFNVGAVYLGKTARIWVNSPIHHPADMELTLATNTRKVIQVISKDYPKIDPDPIEPPPAPGTKSPSAQPSKRQSQLELFSLGDTKTGALAEGQTIDYRFEARDNVALVFTFSRDEESYLVYKVEIYDAQGFPQKDMTVGSDPRQLPFTPKQTGSYVVRLRGTDRLGRYLIYMQESR